MELTSNERAVLDSLAEAYNLFVGLPTQHQMDAQEFCEAIHKAQHLIMKRLAVRAHPALFHHEDTRDNPV